MEILIELSDVSGWNIISTGGVMKEGYLAFLGSRTEEVIRSYYVDKVFFPVRHLIRNGESWNPRSLLAQRKSHDRFRTQKILVVDSTKFDQTAFLWQESCVI